MRTPSRAAGTLSRRDFLKLGAAMAALSACQRLPGTTTIGTLETPAASAAVTRTTATPLTTQAPTRAPLTKDALALLAANRLMFGPRPGTVESIGRMGYDNFIDAQLAFESIDDTALKQRLATHDLSLLDLSPAELREDKPNRALLQLQQDTLLRAVYSERQLYELMVDFWSNHFNIYFNTGQVKFVKHRDDRDVIRPNALGKFQDLLEASAHSPAMLMYLDNDSNRSGNPNENYARELMELHTLGVDNGYTQQDVTDAARALTGWSTQGVRNAKGRQRNPDQAGRFLFRAGQHDSDAKKILGVDFPAGGGKSDGEKLLMLLAKHPNTADFIAFKLAKRFVTDQPGRDAVEPAARAFAQSGGDIKATLGALLRSDAFKQSQGRKLKRPFEFVASALRALDADSACERPTLNALRTMGQPLFQWSPPNGYPDAAGAWSGAGSVLARWNYALALTGDGLRDTRITPAKALSVDAAARRLYGAPLPADVAAQLTPAADGKDASALLAVMLCSPLFQVRG